MPKPTRPNYETPAILSDSPLNKDAERAYFHFDAFAATLKGHVPFERCGTLDVAVAAAARDAASHVARFPQAAPGCHRRR